MATTATTTVGEQTRRRHRGKWLGSLSLYLFLLPALLYIALTMLYPVFENVRMSLHDVNIGTFLAANQPWVGVDKFRTVFNDSDFWHSENVSLAYRARSIFFQSPIGFALAM